MEIIPKKTANGVPAKCPKCDNSKGKLIAIFRTWKPTNKVSCEFMHEKGKMCYKTYKQK